MRPSKHYVWDPFVRVFHWSLVAGCCILRKRVFHQTGQDHPSIGGIHRSWPDRCAPDLGAGRHPAAGALADVIEGCYRNWGLTASEQDVAGFTIKGYSIAEIAILRGSAPGTVKTHLNAIYRKAGVAGRGQLVSLLVEDLRRAPLLEPLPNDAAVAA